MSEPLRVGVIGCGGIAQMMHLPHLAERPDLFAIHALCDVNEAALHAVGERYGVAARYAGAEALVDDADLEAVLVCSGGSHKDVVTRALAANKHVFVEKPLGFSLPETEALAAVARGSDRVVMVGTHKRFDPSFERALLALQGADIRFVEVTVLHPDDGDYRSHHALLPEPGRARPSSSEEEMEAGALAAVCRGPMAKLLDDVVGQDADEGHRVASLMLFQSLIHDVDLVRAALGEPSAVESAVAWRRGFAQTSTTSFSSGARCVMSWISVPGLKNYEESLRFVAPDLRVTLTFPSPYLRNLPTPLVIERMEGGALVCEHHTVSYEEAFRAELLHFHECIREGRRPRTGVDDALGDARWITAIARAFSLGRYDLGTSA